MAVPKPHCTDIELQGSRKTAFVLDEVFTAAEVAEMRYDMLNSKPSQMEAPYAAKFRNQVENGCCQSGPSSLVGDDPRLSAFLSARCQTFMPGSLRKGTRHFVGLSRRLSFLRFRAKQHTGAHTDHVLSVDPSVKLPRRKASFDESIPSQVSASSDRLYTQTSQKAAAHSVKASAAFISARGVAMPAPFTKHQDRAGNVADADMYHSLLTVLVCVGSETTPWLRLFAGPVDAGDFEGCIGGRKVPYVDVEARPGRLVVFDQRLFHAVLPHSGKRYFIRADAMFSGWRRVPALLSPTDCLPVAVRPEPEVVATPKAVVVTAAEPLLEAAEPPSSDEEAESSTVLGLPPKPPMLKYRRSRSVSTASLTSGATPGVSPMLLAGVDGTIFDDEPPLHLDGRRLGAGHWVSPTAQRSAEFKKRGAADVDEAAPAKRVRVLDAK